jgi:hypothetical protein
MTGIMPRMEVLGRLRFACQREATEMHHKRPLLWLVSIHNIRPGSYGESFYESTMSRMLGIAYNAVMWTITHAMPLLLILFVLIIAKRQFSPLRRVPGPWLAGYTRLWKLYYTFRGDMERVNINLHKKYGKTPVTRRLLDFELMGERADGSHRPARSQH